MVWHIANTTVRTPYRLRAALVSLMTSHLHGNLLGRENEQAFADLLHDQEILFAARRESSLDVDRSDLGRKWRAALSQLGFLTPHFTIGHRLGVDKKLEPFVDGIPSLTGRPYEITPAGRLLIDAENMISQQETFLRMLAAYRIPSPIERRYKHGQFSPLHFTLDILRHLATLETEPFISFEEMALIVQRSTGDDGATQVAERIRTFRSDRDNAGIPRRKFHREAYEEAVSADDPDIRPNRIYSRVNTLNDYADLTLRYLKATGLFKSKGRGITLSPERIDIIQHITDEPLVTLDDDQYLRNLWQGAKLPTDDRHTAVAVTRSLQRAIRQRSAEPEVVQFAYLDDRRLQMARHQLEAQLQRLDEEDFALKQVNEGAEIVGLMDGISARSPRVQLDGSLVSIPSTERAAYFEWTIWRAFLAINSLENKPWDARRFEIDQDLRPVGHAPGGGPDMTFEFQDAIVVVEVTLTLSSRQEAAEGEPVRRHVAQYAEENATDKTVYGLFIAPRVDTNTAHTFRIGDWYKPDDSKINVHIVPMQLKDFRDFFQAILSEPDESPRRLRELLMQCRMEANQDAPLWKSTISELTQRAAAALTVSS